MKQIIHTSSAQPEPVGKQARPDTVTSLTFSDLVQRVNLAQVWGFDKEEAIVLVEAGIERWRAYVEDDQALKGEDDDPSLDEASGD